MLRQMKLPSFVWLKPDGVAGQDDFGTAPDGQLMVSRRALEVLIGCGVTYCDVAPFSPTGRPRPVGLTDWRTDHPSTPALVSGRIKEARAQSRFCPGLNASRDSGVCAGDA